MDIEGQAHFKNRKQRQKKIDFSVRERIVPCSTMCIIPFMADFIAHEVSQDYEEAPHFVFIAPHDDALSKIEFEPITVTEAVNELPKSQPPEIQKVLLTEEQPITQLEASISSLLGGQSLVRESSNMPLSAAPVEQHVNPNISSLFESPTDPVNPAPPISPIPGVETPPTDSLPPVANLSVDAIDDYYSTMEDGVLTINLPGVLSNDLNDFNSFDSLQSFLVNNPTNGSLSLNQDGSFVYTPNPNFNGQDSFQYKAANSSGSDVAKVIIDVKSVNDPPIAVDDVYSVAQNTNLITNAKAGVISNDSDPDNDALTVSKYDLISTQGGSVSLAKDGSFVYAPKAGFIGSDNFTYEISDGQGGFDIANVKVDVFDPNIPNKPPNALDDTYFVNEDSKLTISLTKDGVLNNDTDPDFDVLNSSLLATTKNGSLTYNANGTFDYTPNKNFFGVDTFTYQVSDGKGGFDTATASINVLSVNDPPVANNDFATTTEDTPLKILGSSLLSNDTDPDGDPLSITGITYTGGHGGIVELKGGDVFYTPDSNFNGFDSFAYSISDGHGGVSSAVVLINVTPVNDPPDAVNDFANTNQDASLEIGYSTLLLNDTDPEGDTLSISSIDAVSASGGTISSISDKLTYTPKTGFFGTDTFSYTISDGHGGFDTATVSIDVKAAPILPTNPISTLGLNAVDNTSFSDGTDPAPFNKILQGTTGAFMTAGVTNPGSVSLTYTFYLDTNQDGDYNDLGETLGSATSSGGEVFVSYDPSGLALGTYAAKVKVGDGTGFNEVTDTVKVVPWLLKGLDAVDNTYYNDGVDVSAKNQIVQGSATTYSSVGVENPKNINLSYKYEIDLNNDGDFADAGELLGAKTSTANYGDYNFAYATGALALGNYNMKVTVDDGAGFIDTATSVLAVKPWILNGMDAIDSGYYDDGNNPNPNNIIAIGTPAVQNTVGVNNAAGLALTYNYYADLNKDGDFDDAGELYGTEISSDVKGTFAGNLSTKNLNLGSYSTKVVVSDAFGRTDEAFDALTVQPWSVRGMDAIDDGFTTYADGLDSNPTNTIIAGSATILPTIGVDNPSSLTLEYRFYVDENKDGDFDDAGENILTNDGKPFVLTSSSLGTSGGFQAGNQFIYNTSHLQVGTYNTKATITDPINATVQEAYDSFTLKAPWSAKGIDTIDDAFSYYNDGKDANPTNTIVAGTGNVIPTIGVDNPNGFTLEYRLYIDSNKDGDFDDVGENILTNDSKPFVISNSTQGTLGGFQAGNQFILSTQNLAVGNYNTKALITDTKFGYSQEVYDTFTVNPAPWTIQGLDTIDDGLTTYGDGKDSNPNNTIIAGFNGVLPTIGITNPTGLTFHFNFYIDANQDGDFDDAGENILTNDGKPYVVGNSSTLGGYQGGNQFFLSTKNLAPGVYNTKALVTDIKYGYTQEAFDSFTVNPAPWTVRGMDAVDNVFSSYDDGQDSSPNNISTEGNITIYASIGVTNPSSKVLEYRYFIDTNKDGDFNDAGESILTNDGKAFATNSSSTGIGAGFFAGQFGYNTSGLTIGTYNTKFLITDTDGNSQEAFDSFTINPVSWSVNGMDSIDNAFTSYNDGQDANPSNTIGLGNNTIYASIGVNNPSSKALEYRYFVDTNKDGDFSDAGESILTNDGKAFSTNSGGGIGAGFFAGQFGYNTSGLTTGAYNTKFSITDISGNSQYVYDVITVGANAGNVTWTVNGFDSIDADGNFNNASDSNPSNSIPYKTNNNIVLSAGVNNTLGGLLNYQFQIDSDNNGSFENIGNSQKSTSLDGISMTYNPYLLLPGTYNTKVLISDDYGISQTVSNSFTIENYADADWKLSPITHDAIDADKISSNGIDTNPTNSIIYKDSSWITLTAGVNNTKGAILDYQFYIDSNKDSVYEKIGDVQQSNSAAGDVSINYDQFLLTPGSYNTKVVINDAYGNSQEAFSSFTVGDYDDWQWKLSPITHDAIDADKISSNGIDTNPTNSVIYKDPSWITLTAGVNNTKGAILDYQFYVDSNKDSVYEKVGDVQKTNLATGDVSINYDQFLLTPGSYNTKVVVNDIYGNSQEAFSSFTVENYTDWEWKLYPISHDAIDLDKLASNGIDTNPTNSINYQDSGQISFTAGVNNVKNALLSYQFYIDSNKDGVFEAVGDVQKSYSTTGDISINYDPFTLKPGGYNTKLVVNDVYGNVQESTSQFVVKPIPWSISGLDTIDADQIYGGTDTNPTNTIYQGEQILPMVAGVNNPSGTKLSYQFMIDSNQDGFYENIGNPINSTFPSGMYKNYAGILNLAAGTYNTKVIISDTFGGVKEATDSFTILAPTLTGFDSIDSDGVYGGVDSNPTNVIPQGTKSGLTMVAQVNNPGAAQLKYTFSIDTDKDGIFEQIQTLNSANNDVSITYNPFGLTVGTYNTRVDVTDINGNNIGSTQDQIRVTQPWTLDGFDAVNDEGKFGLPDSSPTNIVYQGEDKMKMVVGVTNPLAAIINYQFQIDSNNDTIFENVGAVQQSTGSTGFAYDFDASDLTPGTYNARVLVSDANGISYKIDDKFTVVAPKFLGFDAVDQDGIYSSIDSADSHVTNQVAQGSPSIKLVSGVDNKGGLSFKYDYEIDLTDDGNTNFVSIGSSISNDVNGGSRDFDVYNTAPGNYAARVTVSDLKGNFIGSQTSNFSIIPATWSVDGLDSIDLDGVYSPNIVSQDSHIGNQVVEGYREINLVAGVTNTAGVVLNYEFRIDLNNNGNFNDSGELIGSVSSFDKASVALKYDSYSLNPGTYNTQVKVTDVTGASSIQSDSFTVINNNWSINGLDSIDADGSFGGADSNITNTIEQGINNIKLAAGINNAGQGELKYQFQIDANNDGDFNDLGENIGTSISSSSNQGVSADYNPINLSAGVYNTRILVTDVNGLTQQVTDSFTVKVPILNSFDAVDANPTNTILEGSKSIVLNADVSNPGAANLTHKFYIDTNQDGDFNDAGELIKTINSSTSGNISFDYNPAALKAGNYNTQFVAEDINSKQVISANSSFTINPNTWMLNGYDAIDGDLNFNNGLDSNSSNVIIQGNSSIPMSIGATNNGARDLTYKFQIDSDNNGTFEDVTFAADTNKNGYQDQFDSFALTEFTANSTNGNYFFFNPSNLSTGTYNIKAIVTDSTGLTTEALSSIQVLGPTFLGLDSIDSNGDFGGIDSNPTNNIVQGNLSITLNAGVSNPGNANLTYDFYVDTNKDGDFNDVGELIISLNSGASLGTQTTYNPSALALGDYNTQVIVKDSKGVLIGQDTDTFTVSPLAGAYSFNSLDSIQYDIDNQILENRISNQIDIRAYVDNTQKTGLKYDFYVDDTDNGIADYKLINSFTSDNSFGATVNYNTNNLNAGNYATKVNITDVLGNSTSKTDAFTILPQDANNFSLDSIQGNATNEILHGNNQITLEAKLNNPGNRDLNYKFQVDLNKDGDFLDAGETITNLNSNSSNGLTTNFNTSALLPGTYNTQLLITDSIDASVDTVTNSFKVNPLVWTANGLDSIDSDGNFGGADSNLTNTIPLGTTGITLVAGVSNTNATLDYQFYVDTNKDGDFNDAGELIKTFTDSTASTGVSTGFNPFNLSAGTYNTKVVITDQVGLSSTQTNSFTITNPSGLLLDAVDGGANTITQGTASINMSASLSNTGEAGLTYTFLIDRNNDGDFVDLTDFIGSAASNSATGTTRIFDTSALLTGTYNLRVLVYDLSNVLIAQDDDVLNVV